MEARVDAIEAILGRRSIRKYEDRAVEPEKIDTLVRAGLAAPSAGNQQSWRFVVVTDRAQLDLLSVATPYSGMLAHAPLAIVVCGDTTSVKYPEPYWVEDCSAAMQNILVAARALGLGACWLGYHPREDRKEEARRILGLPDGIDTLGVASIGYPAEERSPSGREAADFVRYDRWG
jgi:nitroreductase